MNTGPGEPLGEGDGESSGGGVAEPGACVGGGGTRICGPIGACGLPTYGAGVGEADDSGAGPVGSGVPVTCATGTGEGSGCVEQPCCSSPFARASSSCALAKAVAGGMLTKARASATSAALARGMRPLTGLRAR